MAPALSLYEDDESRWRAVQARDAVADGFFVYAVRTTKIYCRPICKARLARRANVRFYATGQDAREAGFRACKRCKPEQGGLMPEEMAVCKIRAFIKEAEEGQAAGGGEKIQCRGSTASLGQMARQTGLSKWHFHRVFKACAGVTPFEYARGRRELGNGESTDDPAMTLELHGDAGADGGFGWLQHLDAATGLDFDFGFLDGQLAADTGSGGLTSLSGTSPRHSGTGTGSSGSIYSPIPLDDLLAWPGEGQ